MYGRVCWVWALLWGPNRFHDVLDTHHKGCRSFGWFSRLPMSSCSYINTPWSVSKVTWKRQHTVLCIQNLLRNNIRCWDSDDKNRLLRTVPKFTSKELLIEKEHQEKIKVLGTNAFQSTQEQIEGSTPHNRIKAVFTVLYCMWDLLKGKHFRDGQNVLHWLILMARVWHWSD